MATAGTGTSAGSVNTRWTEGLLTLHTRQGQRQAEGEKPKTPEDPNGHIHGLFPRWPATLIVAETAVMFLLLLLLVVVVVVLVVLVVLVLVVVFHRRRQKSGVTPRPPSLWSYRGAVPGVTWWKPLHERRGRRAVRLITLPAAGL